MIAKNVEASLVASGIQEALITTAAGQPMYGGTGPVVPGNGGLDLNLTFVYPNRQPAGQTTVHINH